MSTQAASGAVPVPLRRALDLDSLCRENPCDRVIVLGSFWPNSRGSFESHVVKSFKECVPARDFQPHISALCEFYAHLILSATGSERFDSIARVLSSSERELEIDRPQSLLADRLCAVTGAGNLSSLFFKSESRPSMRTVSRLSGPDALRPRVQYVLQDLFVRPRRNGGSVLLIDDIFNTGASARVYARALKEFAGAKSVVVANLAATRFQRGRDGHGALSLDTSRMEANDSLRCTWLDENDLYHRLRDCPAAGSRVSPELAFVSARRGMPCPECSTIQAAPRRKWWQIF